MRADVFVLALSIIRHEVYVSFGEDRRSLVD